MHCEKSLTVFFLFFLFNYSFPTQLSDNFFIIIMGNESTNIMRLSPGFMRLKGVGQFFDEKDLSDNFFLNFIINSKYI